MLSILFPVVGLGIVAALFCLLLKQYRPEYALAASVISGAILFWIVLSQMAPLFDTIRSILSRVESGNEYADVIVRSLGVCFLTQLAADACRDAGEKALAGKIELAGRVTVLLLALPMFTALLNVALGLIT